MAKNSVSKISNAFSTGSGGGNFEQQIQAMFLLSLLVDGFCPAMHEQTKRVCFQTKHLGYDVDDLVVFTDRNMNEGKMLCQIKHSITATKNDRTFQDVICAAWSDFNKDNFDKENDRIALVTAKIANSAQNALRFLHAEARGAIDERDFCERINVKKFSNSKNEEMLNTIKCCIALAMNNNPTDVEIWRFCKIFILLLFDMDCEESVNRTLSAALIKGNSSYNAFLVWSRLVEYAGQCNQDAASVDMGNIDKDILTLFFGKKRMVVLLDPITEIDLFMRDVALIGEWQEDNEYDRQIIEKIYEKPYPDFEIKARSMIYQHPEYLQLVNGRWRVLYKEEMLSQCKNLFFDEEIARIFEAVKMILTQKSKHVMSQTTYCFTSGSDYDNSHELRKSLVKSVCWLKKMLFEIPNCNHNKTEGYMIRLVNDLLKNADWTIWASLSDCLQNLAELAPNAFLDNVEQCVLYKKREILQLFPKKNSDWFTSNNYFSSILWSLEILAWSPDYLARTISVLGLLEDLPYEQTNWVNTPINSIVAILLPWYPQTLGDFEKRKNALRCLKNDSPNTFWQVIKKLLPNYIRTTSNNPRPQYLSLSIPKEIKVTSAAVSACYAFLLEWAVEIVSKEMEKQVDLIDQIGFMYEPTLSKYLDCIERNVEIYSDEDAFTLWLNLRERIAVLKPEKGMIIYKQLDRINLLINKLEPTDIRIKYRELYFRNRYLFDKRDYTTSWEEYENEKVSAIKEIFNKFGIEETERFGYSVNHLTDVAGKLGQTLEVEEISQIIEAYSLGNVLQEFAVYCIRAFIFAKGADGLLNTVLCQKNEGFILGILSKIPFSMQLLKVIKTLLPDDVEYWKNASMPFICQEDDAEELKLIVNKLILCKRFVTAINLVGKSAFDKILDADSIYNLLKLAGTEESIGHETFDRYSVEKVIEWLQRQESISLDARSDIEFIFLPFMNSFSKLQPRALHTRISLDADYFCSMLELYFKKSNDDELVGNLNKGLSERLGEILFRFRITPGVDWSGNFDSIKFKSWMSTVKKWSEENDRYTVAMSTVGSGLSYAELDDEQLPEASIMEELNQIANDDLRRGYFLGVINQRGAHFVDPEGKPEFELAEKYNKRADKAEAKGYSRYADVLRAISNNYRKEAEHNIASAKKRLEIE